MECMTLNRFYAVKASLALTARYVPCPKERKCKLPPAFWADYFHFGQTIFGVSKDSHTKSNIIATLLPRAYGTGVFRKTHPNRLLNGRCIRRRKTPPKRGKAEKNYITHFRGHEGDQQRPKVSDHEHRIKFRGHSSFFTLLSTISSRATTSDKNRNIFLTSFR